MLRAIAHMAMGNHTAQRNEYGQEYVSDQTVQCLGMHSLKKNLKAQGALAGQLCTDA